MEEYNVNISVPPQDDHSDYIKVRGPPANVRRAADALADKVKSLELEKEDRVITLNCRNSLPIHDEWTFPSLSFGQVHFHF